MFIELTNADGDKYPVLVNVERIMWAAPLENGETRLYMNVADDEGKPAELDVTEDYNEVTKILTTKGHYDAKHRKTDKRQD